MQVVLQPTTSPRIEPLPEPSPRQPSSQPEDERKPDVSGPVKVQATVTVVRKQQRTTKNKIETTTNPARKPKAPGVRRARAPADKRTDRTDERRRQMDTDENTMKQWQESFKKHEERKNLGEKEYRIRTSRKNKMKVDQLMQSIGQSKRIQKEN
jgi:hypothetical protein